MSKTNLCVNYLYVYTFKKPKRLMIFGTCDMTEGQRFPQWIVRKTLLPLPTPSCHGEPNLALHRPPVQGRLPWGRMRCWPAAVEHRLPGGARACLRRGEGGSQSPRPPGQARHRRLQTPSPHDKDFAILELNDHIRTHVLLGGTSNYSCRELCTQDLSENFVSF